MFESMEADLKEMNNGVETLERNLVELQELHYVLQYTDPFFEHVSFRIFKSRNCSIYLLLYPFIPHFIMFY